MDEWINVEERKPSYPITKWGYIKRFSTINWWGISIQNKGGIMDFRFQWYPPKEFMFYLRLPIYRIVFGPGGVKGYKGIKRVIKLPRMEK